MADKQFLSRKEAARFLTSIGYPISDRTLERMANNNNAGNGPPYKRYRWRTVSYDRQDLIAWAEKNTTRVA